MKTLTEAILLNLKEESSWKELKHKAVSDSDGFSTDYTMYTDGNKYVCVFGDKDLYTPEDEEFDWEGETEREANEWFDSYTGLNESSTETLNSTESVCIDEFRGFCTEEGYDPNTCTDDEFYDLVHRIVYKYNEANAESAYEDYDFYEEEANFKKVYDVLVKEYRENKIEESIDNARESAREDLNVEPGSDEEDFLNKEIDDFTSKEIDDLALELASFAVNTSDNDSETDNYEDEVSKLYNQYKKELQSPAFVNQVIDLLQTRLDNSYVTDVDYEDDLKLLNNLKKFSEKTKSINESTDREVAMSLANIDVIDMPEGEDKDAKLTKQFERYTKALEKDDTLVHLRDKAKKKLSRTDDTDEDKYEELYKLVQDLNKMIKKRNLTESVENESNLEEGILKMFSFYDLKGIYVDEVMNEFDLINEHNLTEDDIINAFKSIDSKGLANFNEENRELVLNRINENLSSDSVTLESISDNGYIDVDVYDSEYDTYVAYVCDFNDTDEDNYFKFIRLLGRMPIAHPSADDVMEGKVECDFSRVFEEYYDKIIELNHERDLFDFDEEDKESTIETLTMMIDDLLPGFAGDSVYKFFVDVFSSK